MSPMPYGDGSDVTCSSTPEARYPGRNGDEKWACSSLLVPLCSLLIVDLRSAGDQYDNRPGGYQQCLRVRKRRFLVRLPCVFGGGHGGIGEDVPSVSLMGGGYLKRQRLP